MRAAAFFSNPSLSNVEKDAVQKGLGPEGVRNDPKTKDARQATLDASAKEAKAKRPSPLGGGK